MIDSLFFQTFAIFVRFLSTCQNSDASDWHFIGNNRGDSPSTGLPSDRMISDVPLVRLLLLLLGISQLRIHWFSFPSSLEAQESVPELLRIGSFPLNIYRAGCGAESETKTRLLNNLQLGWYMQIQNLASVDCGGTPFYFFVCSVPCSVCFRALSEP